MCAFTSIRRLFSSGATPSSQLSVSENVTILQGFEWYAPADQRHWKRLRMVLADLKAIGVDNIWLPPGCKASGPNSNGYDIYDLYDLGEFDWKMSKHTKWGPREDLVQLSARAQELGLGLYWDAVLNHKAAADRKEACQAVEVEADNRLKEVGEPAEIDAWTCFDFPARGDTHSSQKYTSKHFTGTDFNAKDGTKAIFRFTGDGRGWAQDVDDENGNADYLMFSDLDYRNPEVIDDVCNWGRWVGDQIPLKGMRIDAIRHISEAFIHQFIDSVRRQHGSDQFFLGEYWKDSLPSLRKYLKRMAYKLTLFDAPLVYNLAKASKIANFDLRTIFVGTLVSTDPQHAVTLVMNHDTQPGQALAPAATVAPRFSHMAHALILLRDSGTPCLFYGSLYATRGPKPAPPDPAVADFCLARKLYAYGKQRDYMPQPNCIGWTREGCAERSDGSGLAVLMANWEADKTQQVKGKHGKPTEVLMRAKMEVGKQHTGEIWTDLLGKSEDEVEIDGKGRGEFFCQQYGVTVWVRRDAPGRDRFGKL